MWRSQPRVTNPLRFNHQVTKLFPLPYFTTTNCAVKKKKIKGKCNKSKHQNNYEECFDELNSRPNKAMERISKPDYKSIRRFQKEKKEKSFRKENKGNRGMHIQTNNV